MEDAIFLARGRKKVHAWCTAVDQLRAAGILQKRLMELDNVVMKWDSVVDEIVGEEQVEAVAASCEDRQGKKCVKLTESS